MRIRSIKPEFWRYPAVSALPYDLRLLVIGLWSYVDDNGVGVDDYRQIAADLFGLDDDPMSAREFVREGLARLSRTLDPLSGKPLIYRYTVGGRSYLFGTTWEGDLKQRVDKPNKPRYPRYDDPDAVIGDAVTSNSGESPEGSENVRESLVPGTGEQGNRGTGELKNSCSSEPMNDSEPPMLDVPPPPKAPELGSDDDPEWCAFWAAYPRKAAKAGARKAWASALKGTGQRPPARPIDIITAARRYANDPNRVDQFTAMPTTWLNQARWQDDPLPERAPAGAAKQQHQAFRNPDPSEYYKGL